MNRKNTVLYAIIVVVVFLATQMFAVCRSAVTPVAVFAAESCGEGETSSDEEKCIYLTFDDGPSDRVTPKILDVLKQENVKATFFIVGIPAETRRGIVKREYDEGHCVAVHSYSHMYSDIYSSPEKLISDIEKCNNLIHEVTGEYSTVYRFPGGSFTVGENFIAKVISSGMRYVDWNASTRDAEIYNPTVSDLYKAAIDTPANRQRIVLLSHDSTDKLTTAYALKSIIDYYKSRGYTFKRF